MRTDLGAVTAYAAAVGAGYTGTPEEFEKQMADYGKGVQQVATDREAVEEAKKHIDQTVEQFDEHVSETEQAALTSIGNAAEEAKIAGVKAIDDAKFAGVKAVDDAKTSGVQAVKDAQTAGVGAVTKAQNDAETVIGNVKTSGVAAVEQARTDGVSALNDAKTEGINAVKEKVSTFDTHASETEQEALTKIANARDASIKAVEDAMTETLEDKIKRIYYNKRTGKVYQTKIWKFNSNPTSSCEKLLDNAGLVCEPSTDTVEGRDDYADIPLFQWQHVNYIRDDDGAPRPIALEDTPDYQVSGPFDVGSMQMSFWYKIDTTHKDYDLYTISDWPHPELGLVPWPECVKADHTMLPWCIGSAYFSGLASDGLLRTQPGLIVENFQSHNDMVTNYQKKGAGYWGAGSIRETFQILFNAIKYETKNSQNVCRGCAGYNYQYSASVEREEKLKYFPLTNAQAANILVGSCVYVGYGALNGDTVNIDRGVTTMQAYSGGMVRVLRIEALDDANKAVYLDVKDGFDTMPVSLSDSVTGKITLSTMAWPTGTTDAVIDKHDGSPVSNTDSKHPYRIQGREYALGVYHVSSDTVIQVQTDYSFAVYVAPRGTAHTSNETEIKDTYKQIGIIPAMEDGGDWWVGDVKIDPDTGAWYPSVIGSGDSQGFGDHVYAGSTSASGFREYLQGGYLCGWSLSGAACLACWNEISGTLWYSGGCD